MSSGLKRVRNLRVSFSALSVSALRKIVSSILDEDEKEVFTRVDIERAHINYYTKLFSL